MIVVMPSISVLEYLLYMDEHNRSAEESLHIEFASVFPNHLIPKIQKSPFLNIKSHQETERSPN